MVLNASAYGRRVTARLNTEQTERDGSEEISAVKADL
jgi:hypothetical protein